MTTIQNEKPAGTAGVKSINSSVVFDNLERKRPFRSIFTAAVLGAAFALSGCAANDLMQSSSSTKHLKSTGDALFSAFADCLLPGFNDIHDYSHAGIGTQCRLR